MTPEPSKPAWKDAREGDVRFIPCYCGGEVKMVYQRDKIVYFGERRYQYKRPRWQIVNCFPRRTTPLPQENE